LLADSTIDAVSIVTMWDQHTEPAVAALQAGKSIRQFCANANARFQACADFDAKRQFLADHVERVIFNRYKVTITGFVPIQSASGETKLQFRIAGEINKSAVRIKAADRSRWNDPNRTSPEGWGLWKTLMGLQETTV
jgi:hypothetical protein